MPLIPEGTKTHAARRFAIPVVDCDPYETELPVQAILDAIPLAAILIDRKERIVLANDAGRNLLDEGALGRLYPTALRQASMQTAIEQALHHGQASQARYTRQEMRSEILHRATVSPVSEGALCVFEDITGSEQITQMRRDFVANVSHELRTPLTALLGFIETLQGAAKDDPNARARFLDVMAREAGRMNRLVGDLLSLSRVEAEERVRPSQSIDIAALAQRVTSDLRPMAENTQVELQLQGAEKEAFLRADADQMTQVMTNLIENAVKYGGPEKVVTISLNQIKHDPELRGPALHIEVRDQGEGIDPIHLPRLTERFYRVDSHRSREKGGTGLGLAIVKHIVNRHRGRLKIDSALGKGSRVSIYLPTSEKLG